MSHFEINSSSREEANRYTDLNNNNSVPRVNDNQSAHGVPIGNRSSANVALNTLITDILCEQQNLEALFALPNATLLREFDITQKNLDEREIPRHINLEYLRTYQYILKNTDKSSLKISSQSLGENISELRCLPKVIERCDTLRELILDHLDIRELNDSFYGLENLRVIKLISTPLDSIRDFGTHFPLLNEVVLEDTLLFSDEVNFLRQSNYPFIFCNAQKAFGRTQTDAPVQNFQIVGGQMIQQIYQRPIRNPVIQDQMVDMQQHLLNQIPQLPVQQQVPAAPPQRPSRLCGENTRLIYILLFVGVFFGFMLEPVKGWITGKSKWKNVNE